MNYFRKSMVFGLIALVTPFSTFFLSLSFLYLVMYFTAYFPYAEKYNGVHILYTIVWCAIFNFYLKLNGSDEFLQLFLFVSLTYSLCMSTIRWLTPNNKKEFALIDSINAKKVELEKEMVNEVKKLYITPNKEIGIIYQFQIYNLALMLKLNKFETFEKKEVIKNLVKKVLYRNNFKF